MLSREELIKLSDLDESTLSLQQLKAKKSVLARGFSYYGKLKTIYWQHWTSFQCIHNRGNVSDEFPRNLEGFINFLLYLGDVPDNMTRPSVGRFDHSKGYETGNFEWQGLSENSSEGSNRRINSPNFKLTIPSNHIL